MLQEKLTKLIEIGLTDLAIEFAEGKTAAELKSVFRDNEWSMKSKTKKSDLAILLVSILDGSHQPKTKKYVRCIEAIEKIEVKEQLINYQAAVFQLVKHGLNRKVAEKKLIPHIKYKKGLDSTKYVLKSAVDNIKNQTKK